MSNEQPPTDEGALAKHNRHAKARQGPETAPAAERFREQMLTIMNEYEQARRVEIVAAGGDPDEDRDPLEFVRDLAEGYEQRRDDATARNRYLDQVARQLTPEDVRALRVAAEAVKKITPLIIRIAADEDGMTPAQIAEDLGMTESYVYRMLREHRANFDPQ
ncbi:helix-turn-helix domain-containing protein [Streptomyces sp. NPDC013157]|uniref:helix-turn-helix domain-containing protein n=1 Tax=Streptomyces sp. NPDC013157 TaxID=3364861 RepID=UPI0036B58EF5